LANVFSPAGQFLVHCLASCQVVNIARHAAVKNLAVQSVVGADLKFLNAGQDIEFSDIEGLETVQFVREVNHIQVEPSAFTSAARGCTEFVTNRLHAVADFTLKPSWERTRAHTGSVSFHDTHSCLDDLRWYAKTSANATNSSVGTGNVRVGTKINIEHGSIGSLSNDPFGRISDVFVHVFDTVDNHLVLHIEFLVQLSQFIEFFLSVKVLNVELVREPVNELVVFWQEGVPVLQVTDAEAHSQRFACVGRADAAVGCTEDSFFGLSSTPFLL